MKKVLVTLLIIISICLLSTMNVNALETSNIYRNINILEKVEDVVGDYAQIQVCDPSKSLLGDPTDEESVAWLLQKVLNYIKILGPILVIVLSSFEFAIIIIQSDDSAMAKAQKKLIYRLILVVALFFIPTIVEALLQIFGIVSDPTCGLK